MFLCSQERQGTVVNLLQRGEEMEDTKLAHDGCQRKGAKAAQGGRQWEARTRNLAQLLTPAEVAEMLGIKEQTLTSWRCRGSQELDYIRVGRCIRYRPEAIEDYLRRQTVGAVQGG